jgi:hypothetical protein
LSKEDTPIDSPKPHLVQEREKKKKITTKQFRKPSPKVVTNEQFISER